MKSTMKSTKLATLEAIVFGRDSSQCHSGTHLGLVPIGKSGAIGELAAQRQHFCDSHGAAGAILASAFQKRSSSARKATHRAVALNLEGEWIR
jgi:hypothetical protein